MKLITYYCDQCRAEHQGIYGLRIRDAELHFSSKEGYQIDLCKTCYETISRYLVKQRQAHARRRDKKGREK